MRVKLDYILLIVLSLFIVIGVPASEPPLIHILVFFVLVYVVIMLLLDLIGDN